CASAASAMLPPWPGRLSTITVSPNIGPSLSATSRATKSVACPGGKPTRIFVSPAACALGSIMPSTIRTIARRRMRHLPPRFVFVLRSSFSDRLGRLQPREFARRQPECGEHLVIVLAERRSGAAHRNLGFGEARHHALHAHRSEFLVRHGD